MGLEFFFLSLGVYLDCDLNLSVSFSIFLFPNLL